MSHIFYLLLIIFPFSKGLYEFELYSITFNIYTFAIPILLVLVVISALLNRRFTISRTDVFILLVLLAFLQSTVLSSDVVSSGFLYFHALLIPVASYFLARHVFTKKRQIYIALNCLLFSTLLFSVFAIYEFIINGVRPMIFNTPAIGVATYVLVAIVILINMNKSMLRYVGLGLAIPALFVTFSRVYIFSVIVYPVLNGLNKKGQAYSLLLFMLVVTFIATVSITLFINFDRIPTVDNQNVNTFERILNPDYWHRALAGRFASFRIGMENYFSNPILGTGLKKGELTITQHNFHIEWLEYGGSVGYILFCGIFLSHFGRVRKLIHSSPVLATSTLLLFMILVNSLTNGFMHGAMPYVAFLIMGVAEAYVVLDQKQMNERATRY